MKKSYGRAEVEGQGMNKASTSGIAEPKSDCIELAKEKSTSQMGYLQARNGALPLTHLLGSLAHDDAAALVVLQRAVGVAHHLQHVVDGVIHVPGARRGRLEWRGALWGSP